MKKVSLVGTFFALRFVRAACPAHRPRSKPRFRSKRNKTAVLFRVLALLVRYRARGLAGRLAGSLALAAAAFLGRFAEIA